MNAEAEAQPQFTRSRVWLDIAHGGAQRRARRLSVVGRGVWALALVAALAGCRTPQRGVEERRSSAASSVASAHPQPGEPGGGAVSTDAPNPAQADASVRDVGQSASDGPSCPRGMQLVPGGPFWVGTPASEGPDDEHPRFLTQVAPFCLDRTEVTASAFAACAAAGSCRTVDKPQVTCNYKRPGREQHPMNCLTWDEANAFCEQRGARLPTEVEWEFAARGGSEYWSYSWGDDPPDTDRTCWKRPHSCAVASFPAGAFGLHDMIGNVWEWTSSYYHPYPWPPQWAPHRVYRGGSWSRRFDKWMSPTLRNRWGPTRFGSHLGFRCALTPEGARCAYGVDEEGRCRHGVDDVECPAKRKWNGVRCARPNDPRCPAGTREVAGFGCTGESPTKRSPGSLPDDTAGVVVSRSPKFDVDCKAHQPTRPNAYRLEGGTHPGRNAVARARGCKNRDVGVGWNSACCP